MDTKYEIIFTDYAKEELKDIFHYISEILNNKIAADSLMNKIEKILLALKQIPFLATKVHIKPRNETYRRLVINNYIILYQVNEKNSYVIIYRVLYGKRDYLNNI